MRMFDNLWPFNEASKSKPSADWVRIVGRRRELAVPAGGGTGDGGGASVGLPSLGEPWSRRPRQARRGCCRETTATRQRTLPAAGAGGRTLATAPLRRSRGTDPRGWARSAHPSPNRCSQKTDEGCRSRIMAMMADSGGIRRHLQWPTWRAALFSMFVFVSPVGQMRGARGVVPFLASPTDPL